MHLSTAMLADEMDRSGGASTRTSHDISKHISPYEDYGNHDFSQDINQQGNNSLLITAEDGSTFEGKWTFLITNIPVNWDTKRHLRDNNSCGKKRHLQTSNSIITDNISSIDCVISSKFEKLFRLYDNNHRFIVNMTLLFFLTILQAQKNINNE